MKFSTILVAIASAAALAVSAHAAHAADIAVKRARAPAPPPPPSIFVPTPISMWNGLYVGVNGGGVGEVPITPRPSTDWAARPATSMSAAG
jgi:hypothetical protein